MPEIDLVYLKVRVQINYMRAIQSINLSTNPGNLAILGFLGILFVN